MFGIILKSSIKGLMKREFNKGVALTERKYKAIIRDMNLETAKTKEEHKKMMQKKENIIKKQKREYLVYESSKKMVIGIRKIVDYLYVNYLNLTHKQFIQMITRMYDKFNTIAKNENSEDKRIYLLKGTKTG